MQNIAFYKTNSSQREQELINKALNSENREMVEEFEHLVKTYLQTRYVISVNNGTSAIHLALSAMNIKRADKFMCSVNSFPSIAQSIRHFDAEPIFVDINTDNFNISPKSLEQTLMQHKHKKLKGIFISHIAGQTSDMEEIYYITQKYDVKVIDDVSGSIGATYKSKKIGSFEDSYASCYQINPQRQDLIATAGILATNDRDLYEKAKLMRSNAMVSKPMDKDSSFSYIYDVLDIGHKYDLTEICAAFAIAKLEKLDEAIKRRREITKIYNKELSNCAHVTTPTATQDHIYTQYIIKVDKNRDDFALRLKEKGINTSLHYIPLHLLGYYKSKYGFKINDFPNALKSYQQILSLPIYDGLTDSQVHYICEQIKNVAKNREY